MAYECHGDVFKFVVHEKQWKWDFPTSGIRHNYVQNILAQ